MPVQRFYVGDRVRAQQAIPHIQVGMVGTVQAVILPTNRVYLVLFDDLLEVELAPDGILEPEDRPPVPLT